jgi:hypothetical protein
MPIDVSSVRNLAVEQVIVHQVPRRDRAVDADSAIAFSDTPIPDLDPTRSNFFVERINGSLVERPFAIVPLMGRVSTMPELLAGLIVDRGEFIETSKNMARALYNAQRTVSNPGLLAVVLGRLGRDVCVVVLKLQYREGMQMRPMITSDGHQTFSATILDDLTLTEDARVFKAALFRAGGDGPDALEGLASDDQRRSGNGAELADFFLLTFLGCRFASEPDRMTRDFYEAATKFFDSLPDLEQRIEYRRALVATLLSPVTTLAASEFSEQFIRDEHKVGFDAVLAERDAPLTVFDKDVTLIESKLKKTRLRTAHGLTIQGAPETIAERVTVQNRQDGRPASIVVEDDLAGVSA